MIVVLSSPDPAPVFLWLIAGVGIMAVILFCLKKRT
jgi:hypothetical protein